MLKINIKVITNSRVESIEKIDEVTYKVKLKVLARDGRANKRLIEMLSSHFKISKNCVKILVGDRAKVKIIEINSLLSKN